MSFRDLRSSPLLLLSAGLILAVLAVYGRAGGFSFVELDDPLYASNNHRVTAGLTAEGVRWAFTTFHASNWHPLTWLSHMADSTIFGPGPGPRHFVNIVLHLVNATLLLHLLFRATGRIAESAAVAFIFAIHPQHVESVAWISSRKDLLAAFFSLSAFWAWGRYARNPGAARYLVVAVFFGCGLMSKPTVVTLPLALLLLDIWPLGRLTDRSVISRLLLEKVPLLLMSVAASVVTVVAQDKAGSVQPLFAISLADRVMNSLVSYATYLIKGFWPTGLASYYPHPTITGGGSPIIWAIAAFALLAGVTVLAVRSFRDRPFLLAGWCWFVATIAPTIGWVQVGGAARADRYTYMPMIGIYVAVVWGVSELVRRHPRIGRSIVVASALALAALATVAFARVGDWRDSIALFTRAGAVTERNWVAANNMGVALARIGRTEEAIVFFRKALEYNRNDAEAWNNLGLLLDRGGDRTGATVAFSEAVRLKPTDAKSWNNIGAVHHESGRTADAVRYFRKAATFDPEFAEAWHNLGIACAALGDLDASVDAFRRAAALAPDDTDTAELLRQAEREREAKRGINP